MFVYVKIGSQTFFPSSSSNILPTCTCVGIHPGRVEPVSPIALTTSWTEACQARQSCASSLDTFIQSFLNRAWPKTRGPESASRSALNVVAHVFSWPPARLRHVRDGVGRRMSLISSPSGQMRHDQTSGAFYARAVPVYLLTGGDDAVPRMAHSLSALRVEFGGCCHCQRPSTSFRRLLVQAIPRNRRAKSSVPLPGRPCPLYATMFHAAFYNKLDVKYISLERRPVRIRFVLGTAPSHVSIPPKSEWHDGQRQINETGKCIRENTALRTKFRGGVRVQACHVAV